MGKILFSDNKISELYFFFAKCHKYAGLAGIFPDVRFEKMQNLLYSPLCRSVFTRWKESCFRTKKFRNCIFFCQMPQICRLGRPAVFCKTWKLTSFKSYNGRCSGIRDTSDILFFLLYCQDAEKRFPRHFFFLPCQISAIHISSKKPC